MLKNSNPKILHKYLKNCQKPYQISLLFKTKNNWNFYNKNKIIKKNKKYIFLPRLLH